VLINLAQAVAEQAVEPARPFGLTIPEWAILLGALGTFLEALRQRSAKLKSGRKLEAVQEALSEAVEANPGSRKTVRRIFKHKATQMGVSLDRIAELLESKDDSAPAPDPEKEAEK